MSLFQAAKSRTAPRALCRTPALSTQLADAGDKLRRDLGGGLFGRLSATGERELRLLQADLRHWSAHAHALEQRLAAAALGLGAPAPRPSLLQRLLGRLAILLGAPGRGAAS